MPLWSHDAFTHNSSTDKFHGLSMCRCLSVNFLQILCFSNWLFIIQWQNLISEILLKRYKVNSTNYKKISLNSLRLSRHLANRFLHCKKWTQNSHKLCFFDRLPNNAPSHYNLISNFLKVLNRKQFKAVVILSFTIENRKFNRTEKHTLLEYWCEYIHGELNSSCSIHSTYESICSQLSQS